MKLPRFHFEEAEGESPIRIAGHVASWTLCTTFEDNVEIKGIDVELQGRERTYWALGTGKERTTYRGSHVIFTARKRLVGATTILRGAHEWTFTFGIPPWAQRSLNHGKDNHVKYVLKARIRIASLLTKDPRHSQEIEVRQPVFQPALHAQARRRAPSAQGEVTHGDCLGFRKAHRRYVSLFVRLDKGVYIPGESIACKVAVVQRGPSATRAVARVSAELLRRCHRYTKDRQVDKTRGFQLEQETYHTTPSHLITSAVWNDEHRRTAEIYIDPSLTPTRHTNADCILWREEYAVRVRVYESDKTGSKENLILTREVPIILVNTWEKDVVTAHDIDPVKLSSWQMEEQAREGEREREREGEGEGDGWCLAAYGSRGKVTQLPVVSIQVGDDAAFTPLTTLPSTTPATTTSTSRYGSRGKRACRGRNGMLSKEWAYLQTTPQEWRDVH
eukprot:TRINITY_DN678_c0_g1_i2.p1 TRINITY_DN678_c0_g1~~TRINITY_DN678_c0_g1_i2.p1  ORF type:complete len:446 (+),score=30.83 TRINITY_DN678_c0_g1_i2:48-1385(+)